MKHITKSLTLFLSVLTISVSAQHKGNHQHSYSDEVPFIIKNGIKTSKKNNTPLLLVNLNDAVKGNTTSEMALNWVSNNKEILKVEKISDLKVNFKRSGPSGHNVRLRQHLNKVPVYNSEIVVHISPDNRVTYVSNLFDPSVENINSTPSLAKSQALNLAKAKIKARGNISYTETKLYVYNKLETTKLIYRVIIEPDFPTGSWEVLVDAQNGDILGAVDKANYNHHNKEAKLLPQPAPAPAPANGTGNVFLTDPLSFANVTYGGNYVDNNDATNTQLDAARSSVTLLDIDFSGGTYSLDGPYAAIRDFENPSTGLFTQATSTFNFNRFDDAFEAVNVYYLVDNSMRYINQTLGITLMPFQYTGGVRFDPHGLNGADNSHYLGGSGQIAFGEGCVDDAEDADVVIHELGHGIHDWLTGGNLSQVDGLSEGSGDYWGQSYSRSLNQWTTSDAEYDWFFNWDGHNVCWNGRVTNYGATYPGGLVSQIHADGQIWATTLMRIYDIIGREKVDKAFLEGLAMTGSSTSQEDAAIAVRQAAIDMGYSCPDINVFTVEFTATGYNMPPLNLAQFPPVVADTAVCDGSVAVIYGDGSLFNWYDDFGLTNLLVNADTLNTGESTAATYTYYVKYSDPACSVAPSDTVVLTINSCAPTTDLVISEIMYNPPEAGTDSLEFIEIYNNGSSPVNVNNYTFTQGVNYTFPNTSIASGGYYLIAENSAAFLNIYGFSPDGQFTGALTNLGEDIVLADDLGNTIDSVDYDNVGIWPSGTSAGDPDGGGASIVLCDINSDNNIGTNWSASNNNIGQTINGFDVLASPGAANTCCPVLTGTVTNTICIDGSVIVNGTTYDAGNPSGTEVFTVAPNNCDSTVTINLTVLPALTGSVTNTICNNESIIVNGTTYDSGNTSGVEVITNVGPNNCDSTVTINLTVLAALTGTVTNTICNEGSVVVNGTTYDAGNSSGTEVFTNIGPNNCDSTVTINLNVLAPLIGSVTNTICDGDSIVINGTTYNSSNPSGTEVITNIGPNNCDSTVTVNLTVNSIDNTVTNTAPTLTANQSGATYQWIDCDNANAYIAGETNQAYTATANGNYAVEITIGSCVDTSACENVVIIGVNEHIDKNDISIYPNPTNGLFTLNMGVINNSTVTVYDMLGKLIVQQSILTKITSINLTGKNKGVYFVEIRSNSTTTVKKVLLQ